MENKLARLVFIISVLVASSAVAEDKKVTLDEVVFETLAKSPLVKSIDSNRSFRDGDAFEVRTIPNPQLQGDYGKPVDWKDQKGEDEFSLQLSQSFRLSHGPLRNRVSNLIKDSASQNREIELLGLLSNIRLSYGKAWVVQERNKVLTNFLNKTKSVGEFVTNGIKEGAYGKGDEAMFRSAVGKAEAEIKGISAEYLTSIAEMSRQSGISMAGKSLTLPVVGTNVTEEAVKEGLKEGRFMVQKRAKMLFDLAKAELAVAKRDAFPELTPRLSFSRTNEGADIVGVGISVPLPFWDRNNAERIRKEAQNNAASAAFDFTNSETFNASVLDTVRAYRLRQEELALYEKKVLPAINDALKAYETQVRSGEGSVFQLWQTLSEYLNANQRFLELWTNTYAARIELAILLGEEI